LKGNLSLAAKCKNKENNNKQYSAHKLQD